MSPAPPAGASARARRTGARASGLGLALRLIAALDRVSRHRALGGRTWIGLVAFALIGIVTLQLGLLKLNAGIGRALQREAVLQRENAALSIENSELAASGRVTSWAARAGMEPVRWKLCASWPHGGAPTWLAAPRRSVARRTLPRRAPANRCAAPRQRRAAPHRRDRPKQPPRHRPRARPPPNRPPPDPPRTRRPPKPRRLRRAQRRPPANPRAGHRENDRPGHPGNPPARPRPPGSQKRAAPLKGRRPAGPGRVPRVERWTSSKAG